MSQIHYYHLLSKILSIISTIILMPLVSTAQLRVTLQQAIDSTLSRSLQIKQVRFDVFMAEEELKQSRYNLLPSLN